VSENQALCRRLCGGSEGGNAADIPTRLLLEKARRAHESKIIAPKSNDVEPILEHNKMLRPLPQGHWSSQDRTLTAKKSWRGTASKWRFNVSL